MSVIISCPNIEDTESLYTIYLELPGNEDKTADDFYEFLSIESPERLIFLDKYCQYTFVQVENSIVLKYQLKQ